MRKWIHRGLKGLSLTTALFVFQACYGTPPIPYDMLPESEEPELYQPAVEDGEPVVEEAAELDNAQAE